ncbi:ABC transporter substrate-binding protein [Moraxella caviae]|uniref:ABC transporter arginine-binding protein 1 n=1 Tax=Moraxella caviae TaxID=34060 RepID=A0A1T0A538_9GAMM|nr:transporter substrate-binding domain-containing protein [Moraxella caviae]OOR90817.1 ABC transporter substrate-binding protein [Moraxella caviae]STZ10645.1 ABC transporter arginine-binding protein 1 precursor [Moraxella caviae]VEW10552.1 ABC transporter arginine-binding protein 1 precursor [Moraxella caviae]
MFKRTLTALLAAFALAGCSGGNSTATNEQTLRIATEGAYAPFNHTNADSTLGGFDVDITHELCARMAVECQISAQDWDGIIPALKGGKFDAIISAMSVTPERSEQVAFSEPYYSNSLVFLARQDSAFDPNNASDIAGAKIAAQGSTISSQWLEATHPNAKAQLYNTLDNAFLDLGNGRADAMVADLLPALTWLGSDLGKNFTIKGAPIDINDHFAIAVNPEDAELLAKFNQALADIKADGTYDKLVTEHFGEMAANTSK